jgi:hypothetical protein
MKKIKSILVATMLTVGAFTATLTSCDSDACKDVVCQNGGNCTDGTCACPAGYEGTLCATLSREKFLNGTSTATWLTGVSADGCYAPGYTMTVESSSLSTQIIIKNFAGYGGTSNITCTVNKNTFTQVGTTTAGAVTISNVSGTINTDLNPDKIAFTYTANDGVLPAINCTSSALKQ